MAITDRDAEFINTIDFLYHQELGRDPDPSGMQTFLNLARNGWTGPMIQQALHDSAEGVAFRAVPPPSPPPVIQPLTVNWLDFLDGNGRRVLNGCDQFCAFRKFTYGDDLTPLFNESKELGFDTWRVLFMGSVRQNGILNLDPDEMGYYDFVRPFTELLNSNGIYLLATIFADAQDVMPDVHQRQAHWSKMADLLRGTQAILSGGNQWSKNGWNPSELRYPNMLWSRGSDTADRVVQPNGADIQEFHPRRDLPAMLMDSVASPVFIYQSGPDWDRPLIISEPIGFAEAPILNKRSSDPRLSWELARNYATMTAGAVFHSDSGMRSEPLGPIQLVCAREWCRGMKT